MKTLAATAVCVSLLCGSPVHAQGTWPEKPVRIIVPSPPGGGADAYSRLMAAALSESLKAQFVVENRPGGNGNIGAEAAARATPGGYTVLISASPALIMNQSIYKSLSYNAEGEQRGISADTALRLARYFNTSHQFWLNLQSNYDVRCAEDAAGRVIERIKPWKEMIENKVTV